MPYADPKKQKEYQRRYKREYMKQRRELIKNPLPGDKEKTLMNELISSVIEDIREQFPQFPHEVIETICIKVYRIAKKGTIRAREEEREEQRHKSNESRLHKVYEENTSWLSGTTEKEREQVINKKPDIDFGTVTNEDMQLLLF